MSEEVCKYETMCWRPIGAGGKQQNKTLKWRQSFEHRILYFSGSRSRSSSSRLARSPPREICEMDNVDVFSTHPVCVRRNGAIPRNGPLTMSQHGKPPEHGPNRQCVGNGTGVIPGQDQADAAHAMESGGHVSAWGQRDSSFPVSICIEKPSWEAERKAGVSFSRHSWIGV
jgi:hypothetical protein